MKSSLVSLLRISRPRFWLYLAGPFVVGYLSGVHNLQDFLSWRFSFFLLYFLLPANIFLYGVNDLADRDTDEINEKKKGYEQALHRSDEKVLKVSIGVCLLLSVLMAIASGSYLVAGIIAGFLFLGFAYSQPPWRWKAHPVIDSASNILYIFPGILGYCLISGQMPPLWVIVSGGLWAAAMHLFSAIPDIKADRMARLKTSAVMLGQRNALLVCSLLWFCSFLLATLALRNWLVFLMLLYSVLPLWCVLEMRTPSQMYRIFPLLNAGLGFILFWSIAFYRF